MKLKKGLLSKALMTTALLASSTPMLSAGANQLSKNKQMTKNRKKQHINGLPAKLVVGIDQTKVMESLIDTGLKDIQELEHVVSQRTRIEIQPIYDQLKILKDDVTTTIPILLHEHQEIRQRYLSKIHQILRKLRSYQRRVRNKRILKFIVDIIISLSFAGFVMAPVKIMSRKQVNDRRRKIHRFYQALDAHHQTGLGEQILFLEKAPSSIPHEFRCPLTQKVKAVPVRIGDEPETYNAESLLEWLQQHLPFYKRQDLISALSIDEKLQDDIYNYLWRRMVHRKKVLPQYMKAISSYYPGVGMDEYMQALQRFQTGKQYLQEGDISHYKTKLKQIQEKWKSTSPQRDAGKNEGSREGLNKTPT